MSSIKRNPIALFLPKVVALLIIFARHVVEMMTKNVAIFINPTIALATVTQHIDDLAAAEVVAQTKAKGSAPARNDKKAVVVDDLNILKVYVQSLCRLNQAIALTIIASAGMSPRGFTLFHKPPLAAVMGKVPLQAILRAKSPGRGRVAYEWQYSADAGKTWTSLPITTKATSTMEGLTVGVSYQFRFRSTFKNVLSDWSQVVTLFVH
jgi:hypothetical protein